MKENAQGTSWVPAGLRAQYIQREASPWGLSRMPKLIPWWELLSSESRFTGQNYWTCSVIVLPVPMQNVSAWLCVPALMSHFSSKSLRAWEANACLLPWLCHLKTHLGVLWCLPQSFHIISAHLCNSFLCWFSHQTVGPGRLSLWALQFGWCLQKYSGFQHVLG